MPPPAVLGRFVTPGNSAAIAQWLRRLDTRNLDGIVVSIDMLAYGGLVASRLPLVSAGRAERHLSILPELRRKHPKLRIYAFNCVMRLAPTGRPENREWRRELQQWAALIDEAEQKNDAALQAKAAGLRAQVPPQEIERYLEARRRNHAVNLLMIDWVKQGVLDFLALSQDDAKPFGLHRPEQIALRKRAEELNVGNRVMVFPGADELGILLTGHLLAEKNGLEPRIAVEYSSETGKRLVDPFEDRPIEETVAAQIRASGGVPVARDTESDLLLFVNVPRRTPSDLSSFMEKLKYAIEKGRQVAVADVALLGKNGGPDPDLIAFLETNQLLHRLAAFAGWNTTANTLGTALPQAYARLASQKTGCAPCRTRQAEFLFHRYVNDYGYHVVVRPAMYAETERRGYDREYLAPAPYREMNAAASLAMERYARNYFEKHFQPLGHRLKLLRARLPWPRLFEIAITVEFLPPASGASKRAPAR